MAATIKVMSAVYTSLLTSVHNTMQGCHCVPSFLVSNYPEESNLILGLLNKDCIKVIKVSEYF